MKSTNPKYQETKMVYQSAQCDCEFHVIPKDPTHDLKSDSSPATVDYCVCVLGGPDLAKNHTVGTTWFFGRDDVFLVRVDSATELHEVSEEYLEELQEALYRYVAENCMANKPWIMLKLDKNAIPSRGECDHEMQGCDSC